MPSSEWVYVTQEYKYCCPKCSKTKIQYYIWESFDGGYEDTHYKCDSCNYDWWVDGIDS